MTGAASPRALVQASGARVRSGMPKGSIGLSERGPVRTINADALKIDDREGVYILTDGVGSSEASSRASQFVADLAHRLFRAALKAEPDVPPNLEEIVYAVWPRFLREFAGSSVPSTTLTMVSVRNWTIDYVSVGDSPVFLVMEGKAYLLTRDHTVADRGQSIPNYSALKTLGGSNVLFSAIGRYKPQPTTYHPLTWSPGARLVICSDGLIEVVSQDELGDICNSAPSVAAIRRELLKRGAAKRVPDNYSAIIINLPEPEASS